MINTLYYQQLIKVDRKKEISSENVCPKLDSGSYYQVLPLFVTNTVRRCSVAWRKCVGSKIKQYQGPK